MKAINITPDNIILVGRDEHEAMIASGYMKRMGTGCINPEFTATILKNMGIKPKKTAQIHTIRGHAERQARDLDVIMKLAGEIQSSETKEDATIQTAIAVGYANAMRNHGLLQEKELKDLVDMLGSIGEDKLKELDDENRTILSRRFRRKVKA